MAQFKIEHLGESRLLDAWPILRSTGAAPLPDWWENEALQLMRRGGGILAARAPDGSVHGLATYECIHQPRTGSMLAVGRLVTFELHRKEPVKAALCAALHNIAAAYSCTAIALPLPTKSLLEQRCMPICVETGQPGRPGS